MPTSWQRSMGIPLFTPLMIRQLPPDGNHCHGDFKRTAAGRLYNGTRWRQRTCDWGFHFMNMLNPNIKVIGVEPAGANCMQASLFLNGEVMTLPYVNTIADGTAVKRPGDHIFSYIQKNVDEIITVEDDELVVAFLDMVENHKMIVENSGLLTVAAFEHLKFRNKKGGFDSKRRKYGRNYHGFCGTARTDCQRSYFYSIRTSSG